MTDHEIRDALRVDPSPEFLARVRTRIASEPAPSAWRWSWTVAAVGALAAMVLVAILVMTTQEKAIVGSAIPTASAGPKGPALHRMEPVPPAVVSNSGPSPSARRPGPFGPGGQRVAKAGAPDATPVVSGSSRTETQEVEILIDPRETRALRRLIAGVRDGHVDLSMMQTSTTPVAMELEPVTDIVIAPITIDPIAPLSGAEGVRP